MAPTDRGPGLGERRGGGGEERGERERQGEGRGKRGAGENSRGGSIRTEALINLTNYCKLEYVQVCCLSAVFPQS